jgi:hypothetical protein
MAVSGLAFPQRGIRSLALGDVGDEGEVALRITRGPGHDVHMELDGHEAAALAQVFLLVAHRQARAPQFLQRPRLGFTPAGRRQVAQPIDDAHFLPAVAHQIQESLVATLEFAIRETHRDGLGGALQQVPQEIWIPAAGLPGPPSP